MKKILPLFALTLAVAACQTPSAASTATLPPPVAVTVPAQDTPVPPTPTSAPATSIPTETLPPDPPTALPSVFQFTPPEGGTVVYDFVAHLCEGAWVNNGRAIPCPGTDTADPEGYVNLLEKPQLGNIVYDNTAILAIPAHGQLIGLFGRFPSVTIQKGDTFITWLDCLNENCNVEFNFGYYDANGKFGELPGVWTVVNAKGPFPIQLSLDALEGQTIDPTLVMRNQDVSATEQTLWIQPVIWRANAP